MNFGLFPMLQKYREFEHDWEKPYSHRRGISASACTVKQYTAPAMAYAAPPYGPSVSLKLFSRYLQAESIVKAESRSPLPPGESGSKAGERSISGKPSPALKNSLQKPFLFSRGNVRRFNIFESLLS